MQKATILLLVVGGVLGLGMILSFYGNQALFDGLARDEGDVSIGEDLVIPVELERSDSQMGIYAIQVIDQKGEISVQILDPYDVIISSESINDELFEGQFEVDSDGTYKMIITNTDSDTAQVFGVIGPEPDAGIKSLGFISLYVLAVGLVGMAIVGIYAIKKKRS